MWENTDLKYSEYGHLLRSVVPMNEEKEEHIFSVRDHMTTTSSALFGLTLNGAV